MYEAFIHWGSMCDGPHHRRRYRKRKWERDNFDRDGDCAGFAVSRIWDGQIENRIGGNVEAHYCVILLVFIDSTSKFYRELMYKNAYLLSSDVPTYNLGICVCYQVRHVSLWHRWMLSKCIKMYTYYQVMYLPWLGYMCMLSSKACLSLT